VPEAQSLVDARKVGDNSPTMTNNFFGMPKDVWLGIALGVSVVANLFLLFSYRSAERETRMLEYYLLELDARVIRYGIKNDDEAISKRLQKQRE
jgi:hypothetical protein